MNHYHRFGLVGVLLNSLGKTPPTPEQNPVLTDYLNKHGIGPVTQDNLILQLQGSVNILEREFDYYDSSELKVNEVLDQYLTDLFNTVQNGSFPSIRDVAMNVCALGNKGGAHAEEDGVECFIDGARAILNRYDEVLEFETLPEQSDEVYSADARKLEYYANVLSIIDVFATSRLGMLGGLEEYAPMDYNYLNPVIVTDWNIAGAECSQTEDCQCGCTVEHALTLLQGMEDYLEGNTDTPSAIYFNGVARANGLYLDRIEGNEGRVYDAIKELASAAYEAAMSSWKTVQEWFSSDSAEKEKNDATVEKADDNKKLLQTMQNKGVQINDAARKGIQELAQKIDPSGKIKEVVGRLTSPGSASGVIDGLLGKLNEYSSKGTALQDVKKKAEETLADLKKATTISGNDDNKEAADAAKAGVKEKIKNARAAVSGAKKAVTEHNKITAGIRKAIEGITPHIFVTEGVTSKKDEGEK